VALWLRGSATRRGVRSSVTESKIFHQPDLLDRLLAQSKGALSMLKFLDRFLGRGSYRSLKRWLDPKSEYSQITYGRVLDKALGPSVRWLEAGCGHEILKQGAGTEQFDFSSKPRMAVGCDLDMASLREQRLLKNRVCCNLEALSFRSGSFEVVSLNNVAEHIANPTKVFNEFARVLKDDGRLIVHTPNARSYWVLIARIGRLLLPERMVFRLIKFLEHREENDVFPTVYRANTRGRLVELASGAGMTVESISFLRYRPFFYFFAPAAVVELLLVRLLVCVGMGEFVSSVLLGVFRRTPVGVRPAGQSLVHADGVVSESKEKTALSL
jgi:SAM-dependent methyltransferase